MKGHFKAFFLSLVCIYSLAYPLHAQTIKGQWKGSFTDKSVSFGNWGGEKCDYVLELEVNKNQITGFSYTYFSENGKKYYTICRLEGSFDSKQKYLEIKEVERTKTNVPRNINNCFQVHKLTYFKKGNEETLSGNWIPAPNQNKDCGFGTTQLTRRILDNSFKNSTKNNNNVTARNAPSTKPKTENVSEKSSSKKGGNEDGKAQNNGTVKNNNVSNSTAKADIEIKENKQENNTVAPVKVESVAINREKRDNKLLKSIEVENPVVKLELYDNGEVDGDIVSIFLNGKLLESKKKLSEKPITINLQIEDNQQTYDLEMYAENLGSIPPNTAVMIVTDGKNRHEVKISSNLESSGVIRFKRKS